MAKLRQSQYSLLGLLVLVTIAAGAMALARVELLVVLIVAPSIPTIASAGVIVLLAAVVRDIRNAGRGSKGGFAWAVWIGLGLPILLSLSALWYFLIWRAPENLGVPHHRPLWIWLARLGTSLGVLLASWHVTRPKFRDPDRSTDP